MATPYSLVYDRALFKIKDLNLANMTQQNAYAVLKYYLDSAVADFSGKCEKNLELRDDTSATPGFIENLSNEELEILALGTAYYWLSAQALNSELLKNKLSTKDYSYFSPANLLEKVTDLKTVVHKDFKHRITEYTYNHGDLAMKGGN